MDSKITTTKFTFRIEPKPGGGFLGRPDDPTGETIDGASREKVQQKIEEKLTSMVGDQFLKQLKVAGVNVKVNVTTHRSLASASTAVSNESLPFTANVATATQTQFDKSGTILRWIAVAVAIAVLILVVVRR